MDNTTPVYVTSGALDGRIGYVTDPVEIRCAHQLVPKANIHPDWESAKAKAEAMREEAITKIERAAEAKVYRLRSLTFTKYETPRK